MIVSQLLACLLPVAGAIDETVKAAAEAAAASDKLKEDAQQALRVRFLIHSKLQTIYRYCFNDANRSTNSDTGVFHSRCAMQDEVTITQAGCFAGRITSCSRRSAAQDWSAHSAGKYKCRGRPGHIQRVRYHLRCHSVARLLTARAHAVLDRYGGLAVAAQRSVRYDIGIQG